MEIMKLRNWKKLGHNTPLDCMIVQVFKARRCDNLINPSRRSFPDLVTGRKRRVRFNAVYEHENGRGTFNNLLPRN